MSMSSIEHLTTEQANDLSTHLDQMDALSIVTLMNHEDGTVATAVARALPDIAKAVELIVAALSSGGRLIYVGAGTSGRLGVLDASECPPTFSTEPDVVVAQMAGGTAAVFRSAEGAEDDEAAGRHDLQGIHLTPQDVIVGISASGRTPYVMGALAYGRELSCRTIALACNADARMSRLADTAIEVVTGPEVLSGSTRLKAATAQKMVLNMLSTASMVGLGKVYTNLMIDVHPSNAKLIERACRMLMKTADVDYDTAHAALQATGYRTKVALVVLKTGLDVDEASRRLVEAGGFVRTVVEGNG